MLVDAGEVDDRRLHVALCHDAHHEASDGHLRKWGVGEEVTHTKQHAREHGMQRGGCTDPPLSA